MGISAYLIVAGSEYQARIGLTALQGFLAIVYGRRLALKVAGNRTPSPVVLAGWIGDSALVIMWVVSVLAGICELQGWMHGAVEYAVLSIAGLFAVGMPVYWWRGQRRLVLALTARAVAGRWPWPAGG
jgi:hypothetical protein